MSDRPWYTLANGSAFLFDLSPASPPTKNIWESLTRDELGSLLAASLSKINRFGGHTRRPYSVAEHSVLVAQNIDVDALSEQSYRRIKEMKLLALLHDAHEAIVGDVVQPYKAWLRERGLWDNGPGVLADTLDTHLWLALGITGPSEWEKYVIKTADLRAAHTEAEHLLVGGAQHWDATFKADYPVFYLGHGGPVTGNWTWERAEAEFLRMFRTLVPRE